MEGVELAARRALAVSRKLLDFGRQSVLRIEVFDAAQAVRDMQPMLRQLFDADTRLELQVDEVELPVCLDRGQFELMMLNIAANARDAMPDGGRFVVSARRPVGSADFELTLADNGLGMPESVRLHVFEPFYTTKPHGHGTGLGLAIVHDMVTAAEGQITVEGAPGQGTSFHIRLPLVLAGAYATEVETGVYASLTNR